MVRRTVYLAVYSRTARTRAHFAIFIPNQSCNARDLSVETGPDPAIGTIIHVIGEPVMNGYVLEFKRNYDSKGSRELQKLVCLGDVDDTLVANPSTKLFSKDNVPRSALERVAAQVPPPPRGQNVRAPIDGVSASL